MLWQRTTNTPPIARLWYTHASMGSRAKQVELNCPSEPHDGGSEETFAATGKIFSKHVQQKPWLRLSLPQLSFMGDTTLRVCSCSKGDWQPPTVLWNSLAVYSVEFRDCPRPEKEPGTQVSHASKRLCQPPLIWPRIKRGSGNRKQQRSRGLTHRFAVLTDCIDTNACRKYRLRAHTAAGDSGFRPTSLSHPATFSLGWQILHLTGRLVGRGGGVGVTLRIYSAKGIPQTRTYMAQHARKHSHGRLKYRRQHSSRPRSRTHICSFPFAASVSSVGILQIQLHPHVLDSLKTPFTQSETNPGVTLLATGLHCCPESAFETKQIKGWMTCFRPDLSN